MNGNDRTVDIGRVDLELPRPAQQVLDEALTLPLNTLDQIRDKDVANRRLVDECPLRRRKRRERRPEPADGVFEQLPAVSCASVHEGGNASQSGRRQQSQLIRLQGRYRCAGRA